jgi:Inhibitor of apoptosis-promoting Bax1
MEFSASDPPPYIEQRAGARTDVAFIRQVFGWMFGGLVVTGGVAAVLTNTLSHEFLTDTGMPVFIGALILELIVVLGLVAGINRMSAALATSAFLFYAALNGFTFAFIFALYTVDHHLRRRGDLLRTDRLRRAEAQAPQRRGDDGRGAGQVGGHRRAGAVPRLRQPVPVPAADLRL